jgi:hypothetical protein
MLEDPGARGPERLYSIYMDIYRERTQTRCKHNAFCMDPSFITTVRSDRNACAAKGTSIQKSVVLGCGTPKCMILDGARFRICKRSLLPEVTRAYLVQVEAGDKVVILWVGAPVVTLGEDVLSFEPGARDNTLEYAELRALGGPAHFVKPTAPSSQTRAIVPFPGGAQRPPIFPTWVFRRTSQSTRRGLRALICSPSLANLRSLAISGLIYNDEAEHHKYSA